MITVIRHRDNVRHQSQADDSPRRNSCCPSSYSQARRQHLLMLGLPDEGEQNNWRTFVRNNYRQLCRVQSSSQSRKHYVQSPNHSSRHESSLARLSCRLVCSPHPKRNSGSVDSYHDISYETRYWRHLNMRPLNLFSR